MKRNRFTKDMQHVQETWSIWSVRAQPRDFCERASTAIVFPSLLDSASDAQMIGVLESGTPLSFSLSSLPYRQSMSVVTCVSVCA